MKRFQFRLERLLNVRSQETDMARRALASAISEAELARRTQANASAAVASRVSEVSHKEQSGMTVFEFASLRTHVRALQKDLDQADANLSEANSHTHERRNQLIEARRGERVLERLKEKRLELYSREALAEEQKELDEFGDRLGLNAGLPNSEI